MLEKIYLVVLLILYYIIVFIVPSLRVKHSTGINPYVFKNTSSAHDYLGKVSAPITSLIFIVALINLFYPTGLKYLAPFLWLETVVMKYAGLIMIHISVIWIVITQIQMRNSWRVGIDHSVTTELKTGGLFSVSRNPVFLGMAVSIAGYFLLIPDAITLVVTVTSIILFQVQVRLEEEYLMSKHGETYKQYKLKVRRWL